MPNRILREGILTSARISKLSWAEECFYRRLMSVVDDFGRYYADAGLLRAACYPRQLNKVSDSDIEKWLRACADAALVRVYPAEDGERYLELLDFKQQARAKASKFPGMRSGCVADAAQAQADAHLGVSVGVSVSEDVSEDVSGVGAPSGASPRGTRLSADWQLTPELAQWSVTERPGFPVMTEAAKFRDYWTAKTGKDATKTDWDATWRNWVRNARLPGAAGKPDRHSGFGERDYREGVTEDGRF